MSVPSVNELASTMNTSRQNIAKMLDTMEKEGLVSVSQSAQDKRVKRSFYNKKDNNWQNKVKKRKSRFSR